MAGEKFKKDWDEAVTGLWLLHQEKHYLSTEPYLFVIRPDNNDANIKRASLFCDNRLVEDVRMSAGYGLPEKSLHDVINYFEARLTMGLIK